jgi:hypothetical protein
MKLMSSYQKRLKEIKFYKQCIDELEDICREIVKHNAPVKLPLSSRGLQGDTILTPYNTGHFVADLMLQSQWNDAKNNGPK